ncbi:MAG: hypothetical protein ACRC8C_01460 [Mycoplasmoidaceae bacterium]
MSIKKENNNSNSEELKKDSKPIELVIAKKDNNDLKNNESKKDVASILKDIKFKKENKIESEKPNDNTSNGSNDLFFEKFNKSKKDFKKDNKEKQLLAKKQIISQARISGLSKRLEDNTFTLKIYLFLLVIFFITVGFGIAIFTVLLPYSGPGQYDASNVTDIWQRVNYIQYPNFAITSVVLSAITFILLPAPYLYLLATWFVGINQVTRSKVFILINLSLSLLAILMFIIILILSTLIFVNVSAPIIQFPADPLPTP